MKMSDSEKESIIPNPAAKKRGATLKEWLGTILAIGLSVFFILVGLFHIEHCTLQPLMPYALVASGGLFIIISILEIGEEYLCPDGGCRKFNKVLITLLWAAKLAVFGFFIFAVHAMFEVVDTKTEGPQFCNVWVYMTAMMSVVMTLVSILVAYVIIPFCQKFICKS